VLFVRTRIADSARNRPARATGPRTEVPAAASQLAALVSSGREPDEVAEKVMRAIQENELYIFTDPEYRSALEERFSANTSCSPSALSPLEIAGFASKRRIAKIATRPYVEL